jgi:hypothetical protein
MGGTGSAYESVSAVVEEMIVGPPIDKRRGAIGITR